MGDDVLDGRKSFHLMFNKFILKVKSTHLQIAKTVNNPTLLHSAWNFSEYYLKIFFYVRNNHKSICI